MNALVGALYTSPDPGWYWRSPEVQAEAVTNDYLQEVRDTQGHVDDLVKKTTFTADTIILLWKNASSDLLQWYDDADYEEGDPMKDITVQEYAHNKVLEAFNDPPVMTPGEIPIQQPGEFRLFCANREKFLEQFSKYPEQWERVLDKSNIVTRMAPSGEYVIDIVPKGEPSDDV